MAWLMRSGANRTFRQGPGKPPPPPKGPDAADIRKVIEKLPKGKSDDIREVHTKQDLENLKRWMTQNGIDGENRYGDPAKGSWTDLPDGSKVGERYAARSTGQNVLDIDLKNPKGNEDWKVHINQKNGGVPEIPASQPAPGKASPAEVAPAEQAPTEAATAKPDPAKAPPAEKGPRRRASKAVAPQAYRPPPILCTRPALSSMGRRSSARMTPGRTRVTSGTEIKTALTYRTGAQER
jgi:hypothetical protein